MIICPMPPADSPTRALSRSRTMRAQQAAAQQPQYDLSALRGPAPWTLIAPQVPAHARPRVVEPFP